MSSHRGQRMSGIPPGGLVKSVKCRDPWISGCEDCGIWGWCRITVRWRISNDFDKQQNLPDTPAPKFYALTTVTKTHH